MLSHPQFNRRSTDPEQMDDFAINDDRLTKSLDQLRIVNRHLGGYSALMGSLKPYLLKNRVRTIRLLDIGAGVGDFAEVVVRWASRQTPPIAVEYTVTDFNPATVEYARVSLGNRLGPLAASVRTEVADALNLPYEDNSFNIVMASMFIHHLTDTDAVRVIASMNRVARDGIIVNDLQRHPFAYYGFSLVARAFNATPMVRHDGPLSVLRGFSRHEMTKIAHRAGIETTRPQWRWAFRWVLSSIR